LPAFLKKHKKVGRGDCDVRRSKSLKGRTEVSAPISVVSTTNEEATGPPDTVLTDNMSMLAATQRAQEKQRQIFEQKRLQQSQPSAPPRVRKGSAPQPPASTEPQRLATISARPQVARPSAPPPVLPPSPEGSERGASPVTVNGLTVVARHREGASDFIVPARPALADEDLPDSSMEPGP